MQKFLSLSFTTKIFVVIFFIVFFTNFISGILTKPFEGDSLAYHLPTAQGILAGHLFSPQSILAFYPSAGETILALFLFLHIPANLFNVVAWALCGVLCFLLGRRYSLSINFSVVFAVSICMLYTMTRWIHAQIIDIWLLDFFLWSLVLLGKPRKTVSYFFFLGTSLGLLIGTKYSGPVIALLLIIIYGKSLVSLLTIKRFTAFFLPIIVFGVSWYIRNFFLTGNPFYPQSSFLFSSGHSTILSIQVYKAIFRNPLFAINALLDEFLAWPIVAVLLIGTGIKKKIITPESRLKKLLTLTLLVFVFFLFLPTDYTYNVFVSSLRYAYPAFVCLFLCGFVVAQKLKLEAATVVLSLCSILVVLIHPYRPKELFFVLAAIGVWLAISSRTFHGN